MLSISRNIAILWSSLQVMLDMVAHLPYEHSKDLLSVAARCVERVEGHMR